ncbi:phosphotransferase family protein [Mycobacterium sp. CBMA293]|uniref:phosphotransferase family protein n=4 Tax=Mycolicibacterium TaxID=1866885 RepID=UPI0012DE20DB|nr:MULTISPECIES: phosphotransferase family protein [unclassified Mycolicibacterium]MUL46383.1 phosphotransferase family protein [Mycolicibacterium sp. CBMA 360]MUL57104.1 phosphotransferase family protein [Mycolicibacterium sp. CBMA 335]MUL70144.1 phosphotransferase family protein [Mycolicibacterium sp. CBMA 311]MUL92192.1 phosphotransferase family protein [Mycolicibacterium sp. CBMA 230]MUM11048.1 phosphotransferase family protein [Mycolicibacterium sp. CBMA 293]
MAADTHLDLPGLDLDRLGAWLSSAVSGAGPDLSALLISGGKSNLTYRVTDGNSSWIVRRPPVGELLATAHDMSREYRMMSALAPTAVPVPAMYAFCDDTAVLGAPFYVMAEIDGVPYRQAAELKALGAERTRIISERLVDTLVAVHSVDPASVGLADFGRPEGFLGRQVGRWKKQFAAAHTRDLPAMEELYEALSGRVPADSAPGIVHGDYRLDNVLFDSGDQPAAVIDWELATIGDSLTDLALMVAYGRLAASGELGVSDVSEAPGFLSEQEIIDRYQGGIDRPLGDFGFYLALAFFKMAGIFEGIHYRYVNGQTVGDGFSFAGEAVHSLLDSGLNALKEH